MEDPKSKIGTSKEDMEKQETERQKKLAEAKKEIEDSHDPPPDEESKIDEQESDGSANAFENK